MILTNTTRCRIHLPKVYHSTRLASSVLQYRCAAPQQANRQAPSPARGQACKFEASTAVGSIAPIQQRSAVHCREQEAMVRCAQVLRPHGRGEISGPI